MKEKKNWLGKVVLLIVVIAAVAVYFLVPSVNKVMNKVFAMFASGDFTVVRDFVASYGAYAAVISFLLMIFQSIAAPLPAFLITFANANLFGWWQGAILSWTSAMAGAVVCFTLQEFWDVMWQRSLQARADWLRLIHFLNNMERIQS